MPYYHSKRRMKRAICSQCGEDLKEIVPSDVTAILCTTCNTPSPILNHKELMSMPLISTPARIRVYCASPSHRAKMWHEELIPSLYGGAMHVVSTWHDNENFESDDQSPEICARYWELDFKQIRQADALLAYAEHKDRPNGTLIEIGYAIAQEIPVYVVGNYEWGTWRHHPSVFHFPTLREAIADIVGATTQGDPDDQT